MIKLSDYRCRFFAIIQMMAMTIKNHAFVTSNGQVGLQELPGYDIR